jgi:hypothetical protein
MIEEDKVTLTHMRADLVENLATPLSIEDRARVQGELSIVNAKIKVLNTTQAARLKAEADRRKVAGLAEAQANAHRALARVQNKHGTLHKPVHEAALGDDGNDDDPGQTATIDGWIDAVLLRNDVHFTWARDGTRVLVDDDPKRSAVIGLLIEGVYAAARGQELPDLPNVPPKSKEPSNSKPQKPKSKKR